MSGFDQEGAAFRGKLVEQRDAIDRAIQAIDSLTGIVPPVAVKIAQKPARIILAERKQKKVQSTSAKPVNGVGTLRDAFRLAVKEKPRTNEEIMRRAAELGHDTDSKMASTVLCQLRQQGEIYKRDEDMRWAVAQKVA